MKLLIPLLILPLLTTGIAHAQPAKVPQTTFRVLYIDRPFTEEETKAIESGTATASVNLLFSSDAPDSKGKRTEVEIAVTRNQLSYPQVYFGSEPIVLKLASDGGGYVTSIPVPQNGGDLLVILKSRQPGVLEGASSLLIVSGGQEFPPGNLCIVNVTGFQLAFQTPENSTIIQPNEKRVFAPKKLRMNAVPLTISADVRPMPRVIFEGAVRLSDADRIMFVAYSPPGEADVFKTDFFMLQPALSPVTP